MVHTSPHAENWMLCKTNIGCNTFWLFVCSILVVPLCCSHWSNLCLSKTRFTSKSEWVPSNLQTHWVSWDNFECIHSVKISDTLQNWRFYVVWEFYPISKWIQINFVENSIWIGKPVKFFPFLLKLKLIKVLDKTRDKKECIGNEYNRNKLVEVGCISKCRMCRRLYMAWFPKNFQ